MKQNETFDKIREWAQERGLYDKGDIKTQYCKLGEEFGELGRAIVKNDPVQLIDAIGDMGIVLVNLAKLAGNHFEKECSVCLGRGGYYEDFAENNKSGKEDWLRCKHCINGLKLEDCIEIAYDVIKNRKGSMKNGTFVKQ